MLRSMRQFVGKSARHNADYDYDDNDADDDDDDDDGVAWRTLDMSIVRLWSLLLQSNYPCVFHI